MTKPIPRSFIVALVWSVVGGLYLAVFSHLAFCRGLSAPQGMYLLSERTGLPHAGEMYVISSEWDVLGTKRGLHIDGSDMLKEIAGLPGQEVDVDLDGQVYVDGLAIEGCIRRTSDSAGRELPCARAFPYVLRKEEYFLVSHKAGGWDSRYFGPVPLSVLERRAIPVWIMRSDSGR